MEVGIGVYFSRRIQRSHTRIQCVKWEGNQLAKQVIVSNSTHSFGHMQLN